MKTLLRLRIFTTSFVALFVFAGLLFSGEQKKVDPFSIDVKALQGQDAVDIYATFSTSDPVNYPLPPSIKKFQIKISNVTGGVSFISNEKNLDLVNNQIVFRIPGRFDNYTLRIVADIKTPQKGDVELVKELVEVKLRPDLKVASIQAPTQQNINVPFSVTVLVQEINMQSSSTCAVSLFRKDTLIQTKTESVAAGGNDSVVFAGLTYPSVGVQNYSVVISDVDPADYDTTNNTGAFSITFVNPVTNYDLQYSKFFFLDETISESGNEGNHREQNEENFTYEISNNDPPSISNDALVSAAYVIKKSDNSVIQGSFTNLTPSFSHDSTLYNATDIANNLSFTAVRTPNGVSSSIVRSLSNNIYYELIDGVKYYTEGEPTGPPTADFLNENTSLVVSLLTTIGNFPFGGSASVTITGSAVFLPPDVGSFVDNGITYITRFSDQRGSFSASGVVGVPILPGASQRNEAKITLKRDEGSLPKEFGLNQNYPNPFNPTTIITFALPKSAFVSVKVYDVLGREVKTLLSDELSAGNHAVEWRGDDNGGARASSGVYLYRITAADFVSTKKMILMK
jgi:hypothetical protein